MIQIKVAEISPVQLIKCLFDKVRIEKVAFTRHVVRLIPLRYVCFPNTDELTRVMETIVKEEFPEFSRKAMKDSSEVETAGDGVPDTEVDGEQSRKRKKVDNEPIAASLISDSIPSVATSTSNIPKTIQYSILFKARNCTGISKNDVHNCIFSEMPGGSITKSNYLNPDVS